MKTLDITFTSRGVTYKQVKRDGLFAVYSYSPPSEPDKVRGYEMIIIQVHDDYEIHGNKVPAGESYPGTSSWGKKAWSFTHLDSALDKMEQVMHNKAMNSEKRAAKEAKS